MMVEMVEARLLAIIELQNAILAAGMSSDEVMHIVPAHDHRAYEGIPRLAPDNGEQPR